jgi:hypothetical protein
MLVAVGSMAVASASAAGLKTPHPTGQHPRMLSAWRHGTAVFSIGAGDTVSVRGGGGDTSNCSSDETVTSFVTRGNDETHDFGFDSRTGGSCNFERSYSYYKVTVKNAAGREVGFGEMWYGQGQLYGPYGSWCSLKGAWSGLVCTKTGDDSLKITLDLGGRGPQGGLGDHLVSAGATFDIPAGYNIDIIGGGSGTSNCTKNETVASFPSGGEPRHVYSMIARDAGLCDYELSWSEFQVKLRDPSEGNRVVAAGVMWLGQLDPVIGYRASCESGPPKWSPTTGPGKRPYDWNRLKCTQTGSYEVRITRL